MTITPLRLYLRFFIRVVALIVLGGLSCVSAADESDFDPFVRDPFWVLQGGFDIDEDGGYSIATGATYLHSDRTTAALDFGFSDSSADLVDFETSYASALLDHSLGPIGGSLSVGWSDSADVVTRFRYGGSIYFQARGLRLEVVGENWSSDFEPFEFSTRIDREPPLPPVRLTGTGNCNMDNTAVGGHLRYGFDSWSIYGGVTDYDYSKADCAFTGTLGNIDLKNPPRLLADFAPVFFRRLAVATASQIINTNAVFLDHSISGGLSVWLQDKNLALDFYHSEEIFEGLTADTLIASILFPVGSQTDWELRVGATDFENAGTVVFVGATVFWYLGW